jgi:anti-sigma B factor antagonist
MALRVKTVQENDVVVVALRGHLILEHGSMLHEEVKKVLDEGARKLLVDLSGVDFMDSHGLGQLMASQTTVKNREGALRFIGLNQKLQRVVSMTRMDGVLHLDPDLSTAMSKLGQP